MRKIAVLFLLWALTAAPALAQTNAVPPVIFRSAPITSAESACPFELLGLNPETGVVEAVAGLPEGSVAYAVWSPDGEQIALLIDETGRCGPGLLTGSLYVMNADGSGQRALRFPMVGSRITWSPDSAAIAYNAAEEEIVVVSVADGQEWSRFPGRDFASSPDGSLLAYTRAQADNPYFYDLFVSDLEDGASRELVADEGNVESFAWSPDGTEVAYVYYELPNNQRVSDIYAVNAESGAIRNVTQTGTGGGTFAYSPDGRWIAFTDQVGDFYLLNPDGEQQLILDNPTDGLRLVPPVWSPDGTMVALDFLSSESTLGYTAYTLHVVDVASGTALDLSSNIQTEAGFSWSPDSTQLVFMGKTEGDAEIYGVTADGSSAPVNLSNRPGYFDFGAAWRPAA